ncbi:DUF378 domain-containing protein [Candidiatus Paracoxiella cheracis]|uniref:DUF378 domain-containing protein n=1 Tax=Candidiatus Paracoxiella cheracis TaxID=3405120 RepID=UPI003BF5CFD6
MKKPNVIDWIALILVIIGAVNWGLVGIANFNLVEFVFGGLTIVTKIVYILVGISGIVLIYSAAKCCSMCKGGGSSSHL